MNEVPAIKISMWQITMWTISLQLNLVSDDLPYGRLKTPAPRYVTNYHLIDCGRGQVIVYLLVQEFDKLYYEQILFFNFGPIFFDT